MTDIESLIKSLEGDITREQQGIVREESLERLREIALVYNGEDRVISSLELLEQIKNAPPERKIYTGFEELDKILDGFRESQLVVMSGITKHGKTTMAVEFTVRLAAENPMWLSFEEPAIDIVRKFVERNQDPPLFYTPVQNKGNNLDWIEKKIIESIVKYNTKIVFIDHLGFIQDTENARHDENMAYKIERIVRSLKKLAIKWHVVIFLLCHLTKTKIEENPTFDDLKGSSAIAQEADTVMLIWRKTEKKNGKVTISNETNLSIQANRRTGKTGNVRLVYNDGRFKEDERLEEATTKDNW